MDTKAIAKVAIYPPLGIARVGNSDEYFLAPDVPGVAPNPKGGFKDGENRIKKQVAQFRVYAFNKKGEVLGELTQNKTVSINWQVEVANVKAAWYQFNNALDIPGAGIPSAYRNESVTGADRKQLAITPKAVSISGSKKQGKRYLFDDGEFYGKKVPLGEVRTDANGRLLFFGGDGHSASKDNAQAITFANNDGWHDDTCDGTVRATLKINGKSFEATPAMVAVTPPDFGPGLYGVVTMNDVVQDLFIREMKYPDPAAKKLEFYRDIYPMLQRMSNTQYVNAGFAMLFGKNSPSDFNNPELLAQLSDPSDVNKAARQRIFKWFRDPDSTEYAPAKVPPFYGDGFGEYEAIAIVDLPITRTQYARLQRWADGKFVAGKPQKPKDFDKMSPAEQLNSLNQAPFEECLGGPFHPGIEITWPMRVKEMWAEPYRLKTAKKGVPTKLDFGPLLSPAIALGPNGPLSVNAPGSLTRWLGVPWQTDEASCLSGYNPTFYLPLPSFWAARVPNQILSEDSYERMQDGELNMGQRLKHFDYRQDWLRDFGTVYQTRINYMVAKWHQLGIIAPIDQKVANNTDDFLPEQVWKETGRYFKKGSDPTFAQVLFAEDANAEKRGKKALMLTKKADIPNLDSSSKPDAERAKRTFGRGER